VPPHSKASCPRLPVATRFHRVERLEGARPPRIVATIFRLVACPAQSSSCLLDSSLPTAQPSSISRSVGMICSACSFFPRGIICLPWCAPPPTLSP